MGNLNSILRWSAITFISLLFVVPHIWLVYLNQNYVYPKRCLIDFIVVFVTLALATEGSLRAPKKPLFHLTVALLILKLISTLLYPNWVSLVSLADSLSFGIFCAYFLTVWEKYKLSLQKFFWIFMISSLALAGFVITQFIQSRVMNGVLEPLFFSGPFGNINMLSEYMILFLPLLIFLTRSSVGYQSWIAHLALFSWVFILFVGRSRSAWIGLGFILAYNLYKGFTKKEWAAWGLALALFVGTFWIPYQGESYEKAKEGSLSKRGELYKGSVQMLLDNPLGVGGGGFSFNYLPYQMDSGEAPTEREMFDSPHSELLKWGNESGWAFLIVMCAWWLVLARTVIRIPGPVNLQTFYRTSFLAIGPQLFFQFPFENPGTFYLLSFTMALMIATGPTQVIELKRWARAGLCVLAVFFLARAITQTYNRWIESQYSRNFEMSKLGCDIAPANWKVCFYAAMTAAEGLYPDDAVPYIRQEMRLRPFDYHGLRAWAFYFQNTNKIQESCEVARVYDQIFLRQSTLQGFLATRCQGIQSPLRFQDSKQFNDDYREWIKKYQ